MAGRIDPQQIKIWFENVLPGPIKWNGAEGKCCCPFHEDAAPSFGVNCEKGTWICYAGCGDGGINDLADRLDVPKPWKKSEKKTIAYDYTDASGQLVYQVMRTDEEGKKKIWQRQPDGKGGFINNLKGVDFVPYRLPELIEAFKTPNKAVLIAEGEKCVDALLSIGVTATTNHGGAEKWKDCHSKWFPKGRTVAICPDNDAAGLRHVSQVARSLQKRGCVVKVLDFGYPYVNTHSKDVYDWIQEGHTRDELSKMVTAAAEWGGAEIVEEKKEKPVPILKGSVVPFPDIGLRGAVLPTLRNLRALLDHYQIKIMYDEICKEIRFRFKEAGRYSQDNEYNAYLAVLMSLIEQEGGSTAHLDQFLYEIADANRVNPVRDWIMSRAWDGVDRVLELCDTIETPIEFPDDLKSLFIRKWSLGAVVAACHDPWVTQFSTRGVLTLHGAQGIGKTKWLRSLAPRWIKDGLILDPSNKDLVTIAMSHWICELGELDSTFKRDIGKLKAFLTLETDLIRLPYARGVSKFPRRTVFAASVNKSDFLVDDTGNSRFWTIPVKSIQYRHGIDTQQVFAQLYVAWKNGEQWWLTEEEDKRLARLNEEHEERDEVYDLVMRKIDWSCFDGDMKNENVDWLTPTDVLQKCCGIDHPTKAQRNSCARLLRKATGMPQGKRFHHGAPMFPVPRSGVQYVQRSYYARDCENIVDLQGFTRRT